MRRRAFMPAGSGDPCGPWWRQQIDSFAGTRAREQELRVVESSGMKLEESNDALALMRCLKLCSEGCWRLVLAAEGNDALATRTACQSAEAAVAAERPSLGCGAGLHLVCTCWVAGAVLIAWRIIVSGPDVFVSACVYVMCLCVCARVRASLCVRVCMCAFACVGVAVVVCYG